ncbi:alkaline phosphatase [Streptomyces sp. PT12]|uniref:alkaline phosphatase D family protein n=1 Tax=Streptomyces sp. PT12 TaxID=1510197 RepID=UPI000DE538DA|nr:alkaline phosphatase D family protein [Streptomyces sp. PT12]RBM12149.1 alkaline phosphatase [Streptomyces sp. PT12]
MTPPATPWNRRRFAGALGGVAGLAALAQVPLGRGAFAAPRRGHGRDPFSLGVASGDPAPDGFVLWTRLAPEPFEPDGGMPRRPFPVSWQVAADPDMRHVVRRGTVAALPELGHSVHVEPVGLRPDREYWYQFRHGADLSPVGRTRTTPARGARPRRLSFAYASCQDWASGYYSAYRNLADEDIDLVAHLGDYVYEGGIPADGGYRNTPVPERLRAAPRTLEQWRLRYALYKSDPDLQRAHALFPWIVTWDDHEVQNDYAGDVSQYEDDIRALRLAAYQAYYEHQPLRRSAIPRDHEMRLYRRLTYGDLAQFNVLDGRQYRDIPPGGWGEAPATEAAYDPSVTMLGERQERWLLDGLADSRARWNVLANNVMMGRLDHDGPAGDVLWHDAWDGFPAARARVTDRLAQARVSNPVVITGDWHSTFVNDIHRDFDNPESAVVATEFVGTSISTNGDGEVHGPYYGPMIRHNPHIRFFDGDRRGYVRCTVERDAWVTDLRMVSTVGRPDAPVETFASFVVENGVPGARQL